MSTTFNLGRDVQGLSLGDTVPAVACVILNYGTDSSGATLTKTSPKTYSTTTAYSVGDKCTYALKPYICITATSGTFDSTCWQEISGRIIEKTIDIITDGATVQTIADALLSDNTSTYQPLTITGAQLDPAAELGDGVTVDGNTSIIGSKKFSGTPGAFADIAAPDIESEEDVVFKTKTERTADRNYQTIQSSLTVTANSVSAIVQNVGDNGEVTAASIVAAINGSASTVKISADHVIVSGFVTFSDLSGSGTSTINGNNITTGTISAERIGTGTLTLGGTGRLQFDANSMIQETSSSFNILAGLPMYITDEAGIDLTVTQGDISLQPIEGNVVMDVGEEMVKIPCGTAGRYWKINNYGIFWMNSDGSVNKTVVLE